MMTNWPVGLSTGCFFRKNILECLETIRGYGVSLIEVSSAPDHLDFHNLSYVREVAARTDYLGLEAFSFHAPLSHEIDISSSNKPCHEFSLGEILQAVDAAAIVGVQYFVIHPGPEDAVIPPSEERLRRLENVVESLDVVARRCAERGIACVLENKLPHLLFGNVRDILWILDSLDSPQVGVCLDTGHASLSGGLLQVVHSLAPQIWMMHVHDNNGHADDHYPPGDGRINWHALLNDLMQVHFHGTLMLELAGCSDSVITMTGALRGRSFLRRIARRIALERFAA